jgi:hypothetical protein
LLLPLAIAALASLLGGGALALERRGVIRLRRAPSPIIRSWCDERGAAIAIVNTDTTAGSFLLEFEIPPKRRGGGSWEVRAGFEDVRGKPPRGDEVRVWVPGRSIVVRSDPKVDDRDCLVWLHDAHGSLGVYSDWYAWRVAPRGSRVTLGWKPYSEWEWNDSLRPDEFYVGYYTRMNGARVLERPGVTLAQKHEDHLDGAKFFDWDGVAPVEVDVDTTTPPDLVEINATACRRAKGSVGESDHIWAYPSDMTVIDER